MRKLLIICSLLLTQPLYAGVFGPLANFDVVNDTGKVAHGFEIEIHDIHKSNITSIFGDASRWPGMERYGVPTVTEFTDVSGFGVRIRYEDASKSTPSGTLPVSPSDSCWPYGAPLYGPDYPCDHFGVSTDVNTPNVKYSWLVETSPGSSSTVLETATVPNPNWVVVPQPAIQPPPVNNVVQAPIPQPPIVNVIIRAPEPVGAMFGEPRWVKATATGVGYNVAVEDLVAENKVIKDAKQNVQVEWQLLQTDPGNAAAGQIDLSGIQPDPGFKSIVYRFEYYKYTGTRNSENEAMVTNGDTFGANQSPPASELGDFIVANNAAVNFDGVAPDAPPLPGALPAAPPVINAVFVDGTVGDAYSQTFSVTPENAADSLTTTVTGLPDGLTFDGVDTISGTPALAGTYPVTIKVSDDTNATSASLVANIIVNDVVVVGPTVCSGTNEHITFIAPRQGAAVNGWLSTAEGLNRVGYPDKAHTTLAPGLNTFAIGDVIQYSGVKDPADVFCLADTMTVSKVLNLPAITFANGQAGFDYSPVAVSATGGFPPYNISVAGLPNGMSFDGTNVIGTPTEAGTFPLTIMADDTTGQNVIGSNTITIDPAPAVNVSAVLSAGTIGAPYNATVTTSGGIGAITLSQTGLPAGLQLVGNVISGTPTVKGTFSVKLTATDLFGTKGITTVSLVINAAPPPVNSCPVSGVKSEGKFKVVSAGVTSITMSNGKVVNYLPCTTIQWNRKSPLSFKVGDTVEWKGYIVNGSIVANNLTVN